MQTKKKILFYLIWSAISAFVMGCSSGGPRAELPADTHPATALPAAEQSLQRAYNEQWDVLAGEQMTRASKNLKSAKDLYKNNKERADIVDKLELFQGSLNEARTLSEQRQSKLQGLLTARNEALSSGVRHLHKGSDRLYELDQDFRKMSEGSPEIDVKAFDQLQAKYYRLAADAKKASLLATANRNIGEAKENKASSYAPEALNTAEIDLKSAENTIESNLNKPEAYSAALDKANRSAALLQAISLEQKKVNFNLDEKAARKMVNQKIMMDKMNADLEASKKQIENSRSELLASKMSLEQQELKNREAQEKLTEQQARLNQASEALANADAEKKFQSILESARKEFTNEEADVYRQGDRLLIRLKKIEFASGDSKLPDQSIALVKKVTTVAQQLGPKQVTVEGHTDSVGTEQTNEALSKKRAETVAQYMNENGISQQSIESIGYGFKKPLTDNKTKEGRAQNRRVDVWITPDQAQMMSR